MGLKTGDRVKIRSGRTYRTPYNPGHGRDLTGARAVVLDDASERPNLEGKVQHRVTVALEHADGTSSTPLELPTDRLRREGAAGAVASFAVCSTQAARDTWDRVFGKGRGRRPQGRQAPRGRGAGV